MRGVLGGLVSAPAVSCIGLRTFPPLGTRHRGGREGTSGLVLRRWTCWLWIL